jgi:hypothetical protein
VVSFDIRDEFDAPPAEVAAAMTDPKFVASLDLPDFERPEVLADGADTDGRTVRARYRFVGKLDPIARRILGNKDISWVQEVHVDAANEHGSLTVTPDVYPDRMHFSGEFRLASTAAGGTTRRLTGELNIRVPLVSGRAEKAILPGLLRRVDLEADALREWLAR